MFKSLGAGVSFIKTVDAPEGISQKQLGYFEFSIAQSSPENFQLTIDTGTHTLSYTTRVRIPDEIAHSANIYSLARIIREDIASAQSLVRSGL
jgi:hypothetical protein